MELTNQQLYGILAIIFGIILPIIWQLGRKIIFTYLNRLRLVESFTTKNRILEIWYRRHIVTTLILIGIGIIFAILSLF